jgi:hypothetical protein
MNERERIMRVSAAEDKIRGILLDLAADVGDLDMVVVDTRNFENYRTEIFLKQRASAK